MTGVRERSTLAIGSNLEVSSWMALISERCDHRSAA
jgi:hypothetical protein